MNFAHEGPRDFIGKFVNVKTTRTTGLALTGEIVLVADQETTIQ